MLVLLATSARGFDGAHFDTTFPGHKVTPWWGASRPCPLEKRFAAGARVLTAAPKTRTEVQNIMNNNLTIIGHVGKDPVAKTFPDTGNRVVKFSVAVKEYSSNSDEQKTLWLEVDAWNGLGDRVLQHITKGREVVLNGRIALVTYKKEVDGVAVEVTKPVVKLSSFHLCGRKPTTQDNSESIEPASQRRLSTVKG